MSIPDAGLLVSAFASGMLAGAPSRLVPAHRRARALAVMVGGLTVANVPGVPLGTVVGEALGWRAGFWAVDGLAALGLGGRVIDGPGVSGVPWLGAGLAVAALGVVGVAAALERRHARRTAAEDAPVPRSPAECATTRPA